jgi:rfaE bifunctional protein nucleotidyltransferase chain/domain
MALKRSFKNRHFAHSVRTKLPRLKRTSKMVILKDVEASVQSLSDIRKIVHKAKAAGLSIVTTNGCFDIVHLGHVRYLKEAKGLGDILVVGVNSDSSVRRNKGKGRPIVHERERAEVVAALKPVDAVFIFNTKTPSAWLKILKPNIHVKGSDRSIGDIVERAVVGEGGGKVLLIPHVKNHSTTGIIGKILRRN